MALTHGSLFSGIGGFDLGFDRAGLRSAWAVEIDPACREVLRQHFPGTTIMEDVRTVGAHNLVAVDVISFGSPCQDLSVAGRRKGLDGARSGLFFEATRIIGQLRPTYAVWENVPGALSSNAGRDFGAALDALAECGAVDICWRMLDAQYFALAQRRLRLFLVASFRAGASAAQVLFESTRGGGSSPPRRAAGQSVSRGAEEDAAFGCDEINVGVYPTLSAFEGGTLTQIPPIQDGMGVRRLTPTECERLQGFPDGWTGGHSDSARYRMLGNAVAVPCATWIGLRIMQASRLTDLT